MWIIPKKMQMSMIVMIVIWRNVFFYNQYVCLFFCYHYDHFNQKKVDTFFFVQSGGDIDTEKTTKKQRILRFYSVSCLLGLQNSAFFKTSASIIQAIPSEFIKTFLCLVLFPYHYSITVKYSVKIKKWSFLQHEIWYFLQ